jgi:hypothetical protein
MSPSHRMRATARQRSRRLRSRKAPGRKSGGTFLPTVRQAGPSHRGRRSRLRKQLPRTGSHVQQRACSPRPASGRNTRLPEGWPALSGQRTRPDEPAQCSMPLSARRQVLMRRTWPSVSLTAMRRRFCLRPLEATDAGQPALGRAATARERASPPLGARGAGPGRKRGPTLSRTDASVSRVFDRDNHAGVIESKNPVSKFSGRTQKPACLSTEPPTVGAALT